MCEKKLPFFKDACKYCGASLKNNATVCGNCLTHRPIFDLTFALCKYEPPISKLIQDLKFHGHLINAKILGKLITKKLATQHHPELIIPVPLSAKRLKERGFNQALEIAKPISKHLNIPIDNKSCKRTRHTVAQTSLPEKDRKKNVKNAFTVRSDFRAKHIAIIDDVVTTGQTVTELSRILKKAGVETIEIWCCAKTSAQPFN